MTCKHCCGAEYIFDQKEAEKNAKRYRRKGPNKTTLKLIQLLNEQTDFKDKTLLDIGGGIGVIPIELTKKGVTKVTNIDASSAYQQKALELSKKYNYNDKITLVHGDFIEISKKIDKHDIVTLERVVCCYPDMDRLLSHATDKSNELIGLVYPMDHFLSRIGNKIIQAYFLLKRNPFRTFIHPEKEIEEEIIRKGFQLVGKKNVFPWRITVFKRI